MSRPLQKRRVTRWALGLGLSLLPLFSPSFLYASDEKEDQGRAQTLKPSQEAFFEAYADLSGVLKNRRYFFTQEELEGEAAKGFGAFGLTRDQALTQLIANKKDAKVRDFAKEEIFAKFEKEEWPKSMKDLDYEFIQNEYASQQGSLNKLVKSLNQKYTTENKDTDYFMTRLKEENQEHLASRLLKSLQKFEKRKKETLEYCSQENIFEGYVTHYLKGGDSWLAYPGLIDSLAYLTKVHLFIWHLQDKESKKIGMVHESPYQQNPTTIHLLYHQGQKTYAKLGEMTPESLALRLHTNLNALKVKNQQLQGKNQDLEETLKQLKDVDVFKKQKKLIKSQLKRIKALSYENKALRTEKKDRERFYLPNGEKVLREVFLTDHWREFEKYLDTKTLGKLYQLNKSFKKLLAPHLEERFLAHIEKLGSKEHFLGYVSRKLRQKERDEITRVLKDENLKELTINSTPALFAYPRVVTALFRFLPNLTSLNLQSNNLEEAGAKALASGNLSNLTSLNLYNNNLGDGAKALASGNLTNLTSLNLGSNNLGEAGAKALANGNLTNLTLLNLESNHLREAGAKALASGNLANLTSLHFYNNNLGEAAAKALASGNLTNLTSLNLQSNNLEEAGAKALASGNLSKLTSLNLYDNKIGDEGASALAQHPSLTQLNLGNNPNITPEGEKALRQNTRLKKLSL